MDPLTGRAYESDLNSPLQSFYFLAEGIHQGEEDKIIERYALRDVNGNYLTDQDGNIQLSPQGEICMNAYDLAVDVGTDVLATWMKAIGPQMVLITASSKACQTVHRFHEQGYSDGACILFGLIDSVVEYLGQSDIFENFIDPKGVDNLKKTLEEELKVIGRAGLVGGSMDVLSTALDTIADLVVGGDKNALDQRAHELMDQGIPWQEAHNIAGQEWLSDLVFDFMGGALSGGISKAAEDTGEYFMDLIKRAPKISSRTKGKIKNIVEKLDDYFFQETGK